MSTTGRSDANAPGPSAIAGRLREAEFVRLVAAADGDALAASGVLARTLAARECPYQVSVAPFPSDATRTTDADCTVAVGRSDPTADVHLPAAESPASQTAYDVARELGDAAREFDDAGLRSLALAGCLADGRVEGSPLLDDAVEAGIDRRPGVAVPTADLGDGLAHSTLVHAPFSGDREATGAALADLDLPDEYDDEAHRRVASFVAIRTVGHADAPPRAGEAVERSLRPYVGGPFETIGGYADVLDAVARERPGVGVALALGHDVRDAALDAWRSHGRRAHTQLRDATTGRYDGLFVARAGSHEAPVDTMAHLLHDFRSPEPVSLAVTDGAAAAVADDTVLGDAFREAAAAVDGDADADATGRAGRARFEVDTAEFIMAFREAQ